MSFLSQLNLGKKEIVYLSVTPGVGLELVQLNLEEKSVKNYGCKPLEYKDSLREIADLEAFKAAVTDLFAELNLNIKSNIVLNLPLVWLGIKELPLILSDEAVTEALVSEAEQSYIFKRYEPVISWYDASNNNSSEQSNETRKLIASAIQKNVIDDLKAALLELGANLVGIETSLSSILRGLDFSGLTQAQMQEGITWNLMVITQNGYSICSMVGKQLVEYYEEPLAIKSFEGDEIYNAINASAQIALLGYPANYLYVISETEMVSAEILCSKLNVDIEKDFLENNPTYKKQDIIPVSLEVLEDEAQKISLEAIGVAASAAVKVPVAFDFFNTGTKGPVDDGNEVVHVALGSVEFDITPNSARNKALIVAGIIVAPLLALFLYMPMLINSKQAKLEGINSKKQSVDAEISKLDAANHQSRFNINEEIKNVLADNRSKLMAYMALGESVPKSLWLTYFTAKGDGMFDIKGAATNVEDVYTFYKNMKDSLINTQLRLHKLQLQSNSIDDAVNSAGSANSDYEFEITNMDGSLLKDVSEEEPSEKAEGEEQNPENNQ